MVGQGGKASEKEVRRKKCRQLEEGTKSMERKGGGRKKDREGESGVKRSKYRKGERERERQGGKEEREGEREKELLDCLLIWVYGCLSN